MECPEQHYIVQGVRGSGKTTLLTRLAIEIEESELTTDRLLAVQLREEEYGVSNLFSFWLRIAEDLESHYQYSDCFDGLVNDIEGLDEGEEAKSAFRLLNLKLESCEKKICLFVDNIVELFDNFSRNEKEILREVLSQNSNLRIIGASSVPLEPFYDHKEPFYQFFKVVVLNKLNKNETIELLKTLGKSVGGVNNTNILAVIENEPEKIESVRRLTGGIPRTIVLLFEILAEGPKGSTFQYLDDTLDMVSPIYKHRMDDLSKQQKPIVHAIAQHWDAISTKEISQKTRISSKSVSAQLLQLEKQWIIEKIATGSKNHLYRLQERFFNIWYLMRYGARRDKKKMQFLTQFLELWCTPEELMNRAKNFSNDLNDDCYLPGTIHYAKALLESDLLDVEHKEIIYKNTVSFVNDNDGKDLLRELPRIEGSEYFEKAKEYSDSNEFIKAEEAYRKAIENGDKLAYINLGNLYATDLKDYEKAEEAYRKAIEHGDERAYLYLGLLYAVPLNDYEKAEEAFHKAIEHGVERVYLDLGLLYANDLKDYEKAEEAYRKAIEHGDEQAYLNLGDLYATDLKVMRRLKRRIAKRLSTAMSEPIYT